MPKAADFPDVDKNQYQSLYPQYIDAALTVSGGRRVGKGIALENPTSLEMYQVADKLGVPVVFEPAKCYARQSIAKRGRVKCLIKTPADAHRIKKSEFDTEDRTLIVPGITKVFRCVFF